MKREALTNTLSVVIPVYMMERYLSRCLTSILNQTYKNIEVILVDDGSTDRSLLICREFEKKDSRVKVLCQENLGVSSARNQGIATASGEFFTFVDADDWLDLDTYERKMRALQQYRGVDIIIGGFVRQQGEEQIPVLKKEGERIFSSHEAILEMLTYKIFRGELCDKIYRRTLFHGVELNSKIAVAEDLLMNWELFFRARKIMYYPIWGYHYVVNENSATQKFSLKMLTEIDALDIMLEKRGIERDVYTTLQGVYGRRLASFILKMLLAESGEYEEKVREYQKKLRGKFFQYSLAPKLSLRQRAGIFYAACPYILCKIMARVAKKWQRNL